jgi:hypothetical protein
MAPSASHQSTILTTAAVATVATGALLLYRRHQDIIAVIEASRHETIPSQLLQSPYAKELQLAVKLAKKGP